MKKKASPKRKMLRFFLVDRVRLGMVMVRDDGDGGGKAQSCHALSVGWLQQLLTASGPLGPTVRKDFFRPSFLL